MKKYNLLGHFKYHSCEVKLESSDDEKEYLITYVTHGEKQTEKHSDLSSAKEKFEAVVNHEMNNTSHSDLSVHIRSIA